MGCRRRRGCAGAHWRCTMTDPNRPPKPSSPRTGLLLTGGGARAAYQVGVLEAIADLRLACGAGKEPNPFPIVTGTSAGAINAAALACGADQFDRAVRRIARVWSNFHAHHVYRADSISVMRSGARWLTLVSIGWALARWRRMRPQSLLDNKPLEKLLVKMVPLVRLPRLIRKGHLKALAVTASSYSSGEHVTFFESAEPVKPWVRSQRKAARDRITHEHLLASSAIPFIFPATRLHHEGRGGWYGDGSMRQSSPLSPAIHLGARRLVVIGAGRMHQPADEAVDDARYPTLAQVAGHAMSSIFLDALAADIERMQRINRTLEMLSPEQRTSHPLAPIDAIIIAPSQRLDDIAARHVHRLPRPVQLLLRSTGVRHGQRQGAALASHLLFERAYTQELIELGEQDGLAQREALSLLLQPSEFTLARAQRRQAMAAGGMAGLAPSA